MPGPDDETLDLSGLACPHLVLRLADALRGASAGRRITVLATDPLSTVDVPFFLDRHGHRLMERVREPGRILFRIETGAGRPTD